MPSGATLTDRRARLRTGEPAESRRPLRRPDVHCEYLDDEAVLYDWAHHQVHYLNVSACLVWSHCDGLTSVRGIRDIVADAFDVRDASGRAQLLMDVEDALDRLSRHGLLDLDDASLAIAGDAAAVAEVRT